MVGVIPSSMHMAPAPLTKGTELQIAICFVPGQFSNCVVQQAYPHFCCDSPVKIAKMLTLHSEKNEHMYDHLNLNVDFK